MPDKKKKKEMTKEELDKANFRDSVTKRLQGLEDEAAAKRKAEKKAARETKKKNRRARRAERLSVKGLAGLQGLQSL
jgi:hypothetical protein